jgi:hypothetical protein
MWCRGPDVPGGAADFGPSGKRKAARESAWWLRKHLEAVRKEAATQRLPFAAREAMREIAHRRKPVDAHVKGPGCNQASAPAITEGGVLAPTHPQEHP